MGWGNVTVAVSPGEAQGSYFTQSRLSCHPIPMSTPLCWSTQVLPQGVVDGWSCVQGAAHHLPSADISCHYYSLRRGQGAGGAPLQG